MNADTGVVIAATLSTVVSYMDVAVDSAMFWTMVGALGAILTMVALAVAIVVAAERSERLPGERE